MFCRSRFQHLRGVGPVAEKVHQDGVSAVLGDLGDLDPRPDLTEDHLLWVGVLGFSRGDSELFGLLHGLRCGGARLERRWTREGKAFLKLDYRPLLRFWEEEVLRAQWLDPFRDRIKHVFERAARVFEEAWSRVKSAFPVAINWRLKNLGPALREPGVMERRELGESQTGGYGRGGNR